jgi:hypothetical protein
VFDAEEDALDVDRNDLVQVVFRGLLDVLADVNTGIIRCWGVLEQKTGLREIIPQLFSRIAGVSQGAKLSPYDLLGQAEGIATQHINVPPPQRV